MKNLLSQVTLDRLNRKKDRSISLTFITQTEKTSEELMEMDKLINTNGVLYYKSNGVLTDEEIQEIESSDIPVEGKSKSQRLRNVLYVLFSQQNTEKDFKQFYSDKMEEIILHFKNKLVD